MRIILAVFLALSFVSVVSAGPLPKDYGPDHNQGRFETIPLP